MGKSEELRNLRSEVKLLKEECANLICKSSDTPQSRMGLRMRRELTRKLGDCWLKMERCQDLEIELRLESLEREMAESMLNLTKEQISWDLGYYTRCLHAYAAAVMDMPWGQLRYDLHVESWRMPDGAWWRKPLHAELLGHLDAVGISKKHWQLSLDFSAADVFDCPADVFEENKRLLNDQIRKDKELLHCAATRQILSPAQIEMFTTVIEGYEVHKFLHRPAPQKPKRARSAFHGIQADREGY